MKKLLKFISALLLLSPLVLGLGGCTRSGTTRFYVLNSFAELPKTPAAAPKLELAIGVGPVVLPEYLDRLQIVTRSGSNELNLAEFDLWAEPLQKNFVRALAENLSFLLGTDRVVLYPWGTSTTTDYQLQVEVIRFDGTPEGEVLLLAQLIILDGKTKNLLTAKKVRFEKNIAAVDYKSLVATESLLLAEMSRDLAAMIEELASAKTSPETSATKPLSK